MFSPTLADPERELALAYVRADRRPALASLWRLDERLAGAFTTREPMIAAIKLAWWRDALGRLETDKAPAEPLLVALARDVMPHGVDGAALARIAEGWQAALEQPADRETLAEHAALRGESLWRIGAALLGSSADEAEVTAGGGWALADLAARLPDRAAAALAWELARERLGRHRWPAPLRPLGMLTRLAAIDAAASVETMPQRGSPRRVARMLWHRFSGV